MIEEKAREFSYANVMRTSKQMAMEDQKISDKKLKKALEDRTQEIIRTYLKAGGTKIRTKRRKHRTVLRKIGSIDPCAYK